MNEKDILLKQVITYLLENPIDRSSANPYDQAAEEFNIDKEYVRSIWRRLRKKGLVENSTNEGVNINKEEKKRINNLIEEFEVKGDTAEVKKTTQNEIKSLEDLINVCNIDTTSWDIISWKCKKWDLGIKNKEEAIETKPLFSVSAQLRKKKLATDVVLQKDFILSELKEKLKEKVVGKYKQQEYAGSKELLLELALFDVHFGKLSHEEESGEDYDLKIAALRYRTAIDDLLAKVDLTTVGKILLPLGQDLFNIDNINKTTTNFTPQDNDTRFHKMVKVVRNILIETIDYLSTIAPVDVVIVVGNHDTTVTFLIGEVLDAYYHFNPNVSIDNSSKLRKYYSFGITSFLLTHGDREKQADLGMIFAAEEPHIWANSTQRYIQIGHYHHNKKINYLSHNEFQGFQIQIIPSLSPNDFWHAGKGYSALRQAKAFLFDQEQGLIAELTHTVRK